VSRPTAEVLYEDWEALARRYLKLADRLCAERLKEELIDTANTQSKESTDALRAMVIEHRRASR